MEKIGVYVSCDATNYSKYTQLYNQSKDSSINFIWASRPSSTSIISENSTSMEILQNINKAGFILCIIDEITHKDEYVKYEIEKGLALNKKIVAVKTDHKIPTPSFLQKENIIWVSSFNFESISLTIESFINNVSNLILKGPIYKTKKINNHEIIGIITYESDSYMPYILFEENWNWALIGYRTYLTQLKVFIGTKTLTIEDCQKQLTFLSDFEITKQKNQLRNFFLVYNLKDYKNKSSEYKIFRIGDDISLFVNMQHLNLIFKQLTKSKAPVIYKDLSEALYYHKIKLSLSLLQSSYKKASLDLKRSIVKTLMYCEEKEVSQFLKRLLKDEEEKDVWLDAITSQTFKSDSEVMESFVYHYLYSPDCSRLDLLSYILDFYKTKILSISCKAMEDQDPLIRKEACAYLLKLFNDDLFQEIIHLAKSDIDIEVRLNAKKVIDTISKYSISF